MDFALSYTQTPIYNDIYMRLPKGIKTKTGSGKTHVLKLINNFYIQKQAGLVCNKYLADKLLTIGFKK